MDFWQNVQTFGATMAVRSGALVVGSRRIVVLYGKQEPLSKDIKKYMRRLVTAGVSPHRDRR